tara:strand:- start:25985 stop:26923 length:939 start_codon:yes stop_codon:yes gene_type:complete
LKSPSWIPFLLVLFPVVESRGQDVIVLKNGQYAACEIEALTDNIVTFTMHQREGDGDGVIRRTIKTSEIDYVEFDFEPGEEEAFSNRADLNRETVEEWWNHHFAHLHRPRSRTAAWGIALGYALIEEDSELYGSRALQLFDRIAERAWSGIDVAAAKRGRLRAMMATGDLERASSEAKNLATQTEDPELLIEVKYLLAQADFERLKELEEDNPRWYDDDDVRPLRNELYQGVIDQFMWPYLFHAAQEKAASRGLFQAGVVYEFGGDEERSINAYRDLVALYPKSEARSEGELRLQNLTNEESKENKPEPTNP